MDTFENPENEIKPKKKGGKKMITLERLRMATERLQLARIRATLTLIALGFTAYKVFYERLAEGMKPLVDFPNGHHIGMFLISVGFIVLILSTWQHLKSVKKLELLIEDLPYSISSILSYFILLLSLVLFVTVIFKL